MRSALGPTHPPLQRLQGTLSPGVQRLRREAVHSLPSCTKVTNELSCTSTPQSAFKVCTGITLLYSSSFEMISNSQSSVHFRSPDISSRPGCFNNTQTTTMFRVLCQCWPQRWFVTSSNYTV